MAPRPRVGILHYTCPPVIGGVETILYEQASRLAARDYPVTIVAGRGGPLPAPSPTRLVIIPEIDSTHAQVRAVRENLDRGVVGQAFEGLLDVVRRRLAPLVAGLDVLIVHNTLTLHFNLALTAALWELADARAVRMISWSHDLSWVNPLYQPLMRSERPWTLLRTPNDHIRHVFISRQRLDEWQALTGQSVTGDQVIPNGIDPAALLQLGPATRALVQRLRLDRVDVLMLAPVRITRRKNLEWAIEAAAAVREAGHTVHLLVTGPPGPHDPKAMGYVDELRALRHRLGLDDAVSLLFEQRPPGAQGEYAVDSATLSDLYMLSDVVTLPSTSEGFGLPVAEAAVFRVPMVCTDLPALREVAPEGVRFVPLDGGASAFSEAVLATLARPEARLRRRALRDFSWDHIIESQLEPLLTTA